MFDNVIAVAANSPTPALNFTLVSQADLGATRLDVPNQRTLTINHARPVNKPEKHYMQIQQQVSAVNPLTGGTSLQTASVSISVQIPSFGWTQTDKVALVQSILDTLGDSQVTIAGLLNFNS